MKKNNVTNISHTNKILIKKSRKKMKTLLQPYKFSIDNFDDYMISDLYSLIPSKLGKA